jgi:hypothetical protein
MKKIITLSLLLILYSQNAFSKIIIFNCSDILGDFYHTFRIDMNKKIVDGDLEFDKGSTENVVYAASYEEIEDSTYIGRLHELRLEEKISYLYLRDSIKKREIILSRNNIHQLFKTDDTVSYELKCSS